MELYYYLVHRYIVNHTIHNYKRGYVFATSEEEAKEKVLRRIHEYAVHDDDESTYSVELVRTDIIEI